LKAKLELKIQLLKKKIKSISENELIKTGAQGGK
jgi:hypothetical protein